MRKYREMKELWLLAQNRNYAKTLLAFLNWRFQQGSEVAAVTESDGAQGQALYLYYLVLSPPFFRKKCERCKVTISYSQTLV